MSEQSPQRLRVEDGTTLRFPHHVKFRHDETRGRWIVLAPERLLLPDDPAVEILKLIDGERTVAAVIDDLVRRFDAPRDVIAADVMALLQDLVDKGVLAP
jgi:pyrroloquinoline quinone biosynthesis protein D